MNYGQLSLNPPGRVRGDGPWVQAFGPPVSPRRGLRLQDHPFDLRDVGDADPFEALGAAVAVAVGAAHRLDLERAPAVAARGALDGADAVEEGAFDRQLAAVEARRQAQVGSVEAVATLAQRGQFGEQARVGCLEVEAGLTLAALGQRRGDVGAKIGAVIEFDQMVGDVALLDGHRPEPAGLLRARIERGRAHLQIAGPVALDIMVGRRGGQHDGAQLPECFFEHIHREAPHRSPAI